MANIALIGSGNVAWHLGQALAKAGHSIDTVYSRNPSNARALADLFPGCKIADNTDFSKSASDTFIVAVRDNVLEELVSKLSIPENAVIMHTSGSLPIEVLRKFPRHGVFYVLQTFTKGNEMNLSEVPFGIEGSDEHTSQQLTKLALSVSKKAQYLNSDQRKVVHIAAVFACNFTNHMFLIAENILKAEKLDFSLLEPLIKETLRKAFEIGSLVAQTGPAVRGDQKIIQQHLDYLRNEPEIQRLYEMISERIFMEEKRRKVEKE